MNLRSAITNITLDMYMNSQDWKINHNDQFIIQTTLIILLHNLTNHSQLYQNYIYRRTSCLVLGMIDLRK